MMVMSNSAPPAQPRDAGMAVPKVAGVYAAYPGLLQASTFTHDVLVLAPRCQGDIFVHDSATICVCSDSLVTPSARGRVCGKNRSSLARLHSARRGSIDVRTRWGR